MNITIEETSELTIYMVESLLNKMQTETAQSDASINFEYTSEGKDRSGAVVESQITNGLYYTSDLTETEDIDGDGEGEVVYYYRGAVENNYIIFGGYCWRIVRTNENGSIKLRYGGEPTDGVCPETGTAVNIGSTPYDSDYNKAEYVNYKTSDIKKTLENWYSTNIWKEGQNARVTDLIEDTPYCNDMTNDLCINSSPNICYGADYRLSSTSKIYNPQYKCPREEDAYTVENGDLAYPIALLTADEGAYAGGRHNTTNTTYYLYTGQDYWTMSPSFFSAETSYAFVFQVSSSGVLRDISVYNSCGLVPVVSLKPEAEVSEGTGVYDDPYVIMTE